MSAPPLDRKGLTVTALTFLLWGVVPLYWYLLREVPSFQIIAHRIVWSSVLVIGWLLLKNGLGWWRKISAQPRAIAVLGLSSVFIAFNWGLYIWAVANGHLVETSLGYFINPLINVVLGVMVLRERLSPAQWVSVGLALVGVSWLTWQGGAPPWIALGLAFSFGMYGLLRKLISVDPVGGLGVESVYLFLPALGYVLWAELGHGGGFASGFGWRNDLLLIFGGVVTAVPLIGFAYGVRKVPLSVVGLLQYIAPSIQLLIGVLLFKESFGMERALGFSAIWLGLIVFASDGLWRSRRKPVVLPVAEGLD